MTGFKVVVALLVFLGVERASSWNTLRRGELDDSAPLDAPAALVDVQGQWGSAYTEVQGTFNNDGTAVFDLAASLGLGTIKSGPNACAAFGMSANKSSALMTVKAVESAEACQQLCSDSENCRAAVYSKSASSCDMLQQLKGLTKTKDSAVVLPNCASACFKRGKKLEGAAKTVFGTVPNPNICQVLCQATSKCSGFTWEKHTKNCVGFGTSLRFVDDTQSVSGYRDSCSTNEKVAHYADVCYQVGVTADYEPLLLHRENISTYADCLKLCRSNAKCTWITHNHIHKKCYLREHRGGIRRSDTLGDETGPKYCSSSCYIRGAMLIGTVLALSRQQKVQYCHHECYAKKSCTRWTYNTDTSTCFIYGDSPTVIPAQWAVNFWSGTRDPCKADA